jgi:hypothetical protein
MVEFGDYCIFKLEEGATELKCLICKKMTKKRITAVHVVFKHMVMGACCGDECFAKYKVKYGL